MKVLGLTGGIGMGKSTVGALWAVSVAAEIAFFWWQGRFFDRM